MTLNFEHSLRGSSARSAHARALYALFVGALSFLILTATMVFYSIITPSAYAETSSTGGDASYYEEVFTLDEATGEVTKTSVTRVDVPQESSASSNAAAQEPSRYSGSSTNAGGSTNTSVQIFTTTEWIKARCSRAFHCIHQTRVSAQYSYY